MPISPLPAQTLLIEGPDAITFAQSQFSSDVATLAVGDWQFSAWLDAQGRVLTLFHLARLDEQRLLLLLRGGDAAVLRDGLRRYVFRAKLSLEIPAPYILHDGPAVPMHAARVEHEIISLGCDSHSMRLLQANSLASTHDEDGDDAWQLAQVRLGWPWLPDSLLGKLLPPALSLHRLQATVLNKGCYPGQEIVARLHYRGGNKRHMHCVGLSRAIAAGTLVHDGDREIAQLLNVAATREGAEALAVIHNDAMHDNAFEHAAIDGENLHVVSRLVWPD